ncbi:MAG: NADAR family protein [Victivallales bacterium]|nr:NADAR family protein [Victivallales bacterium]
MYEEIRNDIIQRTRKGEKLKFLFFWGHAPAPNGIMTASCLSQWWMDDFTIDGITYCCMEQYMMAEKARLFGDNQTCQRILAQHHQGRIKSLGREVRGFHENVWNEHKCEIVQRGNYAKFSQIERLRLFLIGTGDAILVEASPYDTIWGIGMEKTHPLVKMPDRWRGQNLLGFSLMTVRDKLKQEAQK